MELLGLVAAAAASLQPTVPSAANSAADARPIVVTGQTPEQVRQQATDYVWRIGVASTQRQAARWFDPVCPRTAGLEPRYAALVEKQVRAIARSVGAPLAAEPCNANFAIIFTDDAPAVMKRIDGARLREVPGSYLRALRTGTDPIRWWYNTKPLARSGIGTDTGTLVGTESAMTSEAASAGGGALPANNMTNYTSEDRFSRLSTQTMRALHSSTVIVQADGKPLKALVAYAALVGLAEIGPRAAPERSILSLFNAAANVSDLTLNDRAFLEGLYRMRMDQRGEQQRRELINRIVEAKLPK